MQAVGGFMGLVVLFMAGAAVIYFVLEPVACWLVVGLGLLFKRLLGGK